eukprot:s283_g5.t1
MRPHPPHAPHPPHPPAPRKKVTYRDVVAAELELKELERQYEEMLQLQRELPLMRSRLEAMRRGTTRREQALVRMIEEREDELLRVRDEIDYIQSLQVDPSVQVWPALLTSDPLGDSLTLAIKDMKEVQATKKEADVLSMRRPAAWPSPLALGDLWLACAELDATSSFLGSSPKEKVTWEGLGLEVNSKSPGMLHKALDTAEQLAERFSHERLREVKRDHQKLWGDLDVDTRAYELRLRAVIDSQGPLHRALCIQELKHCELVLLLYRRLVTLSEEEANWYLEVKAQLMSQGKEHRARQLRSETFQLKTFLEKACDLEPRERKEEKSGDLEPREWKEEKSGQDGGKWHSLHSRELHQVVTARREVEQHRQKVSAAETSLHRATHPKLAVVDNETRAILKEVKEQVKEAHQLLESFATWASKTEAALTLFGLTQPAWCAIAALPPNALVEEATRLRQVLTRILNTVTKKKAPSASPKAKAKAVPRQRENSVEAVGTAKVKEAKKFATI